MRILLQKVGLKRALLGPQVFLVPSKGLKKKAPSVRKSGFVQKLRDQFISAEEASKRPSDLEIAAKGLPRNTPTVGERIQRDRMHMFHEYDRKGGYTTGTWRDYVGDPSAKDTLVEGLGLVKEEISKWKDELTVNELEEWPKPGDRKYIIHSDRPEENSRELDTISDSDWGEGFSTCSLEKNPSSGKIHFSGNLVTRVPRDGRTAYAGYAAVHTKRVLKSFFRVQTFNWELYTHLVLRIRGDGRVYMLNINTWEEFDIAWMDLYTYPLYTRGGPYWQEVKIPFSKFIFTHRGSIQDKQLPLTNNIQKAYKMGITLRDHTDGPFSLEIDYIGVELNKEEKQEVSAYESYRLIRKNYTLI